MPAKHNTCRHKFFFAGIHQKNAGEFARVPSELEALVELSSEDF